jgi:hypothetical protein
VRSLGRRRASAARLAGPSASLFAEDICRTQLVDLHRLSNAGNDAVDFLLLESLSFFLQLLDLPHHVRVGLPRHSLALFNGGS